MSLEKHREIHLSGSGSAGGRKMCFEDLNRNVPQSLNVCNEIFMFKENLEIVYVYIGSFCLCGLPFGGIHFQDSDFLRGLPFGGIHLQDSDFLL